MYCDAADGLYLKANGELPCWCSPGEDEPLFSLDALGESGAPVADVVTDVLNGQTFRRMRRCLLDNISPFEYCQRCGLGQADQGDARQELWRNIDQASCRVHKLRTFQVESSYACNLDCPLCVSHEARLKLKRPPHLLPLWLFERTVEDLVGHDIVVDKVWFSGRGEPFLNNQLHKMARIAKHRLKCHVGVHTNANARFRPEYINCGLDDVVFAIDGVTQADYERYRRRGSLMRAIAFAADFARARKAAGLDLPALTWKQVLFEWNSSDDSIGRAVEWAAEIGMDRVLLVDTDTPGGISYRGDRCRVNQIRELAHVLTQRTGMEVFIEGYASVYGALPEVELTARIEQERVRGGLRHVAQGCFFNHELRDRFVQVQVTLVDQRGRKLADVVDFERLLPARSEFVDSIELPVSNLAAGRYSVHTRIADGDTGIAIARFTHAFHRSQV